MFCCPALLVVLAGVLLEKTVVWNGTGGTAAHLNVTAVGSYPKGQQHEHMQNAKPKRIYEGMRIYKCSYINVYTCIYTQMHKNIYVCMCWE